jgi:prepilin-type N-terminal cleavage/methylation domain-containing protein
MIKNNKGFTLIELILVTGIIAILVMVALAILDPFAQIKKTYDARRKADLSQIQKALESYYEDNGSYPCSSENYFRIKISCADISDGLAFDGATTWPKYMNVIPADPDSKKSYKYYSPNGQTYYLYASLDRGDKDPSACNPGTQDECGSIATVGKDIQCAPYPYTSTITCTYGASSPNTKP